MIDLIEVKTADLAGEALAWAIEKVDGMLPKPVGQLRLPLEGPIVDAEIGEYLINKHGIWIERGWSYPWLACVSGRALDRQSGNTRAEAAGRAIVHHIRGESIQVPKELMP